MAWRKGTSKGNSFRRPYRRGYNKRKFTRNTKTMMGHRPSWLESALGTGKSLMSMVPALVKNVNLIKGLINVETKYFDTTLAQAVTNAVNSYGFSLNAMAQGNDYNQRSGSSVLGQSITVNWSATMNASATNTFIRLVLVCDKKPDVSIPTYGDVYGAGGTYLSQIDKEENGDRFVIIRSIMITLATGGATIASGKIHVGIKGVHSLYDNTTGADASLEKNRFHVLAISSEATNTPTLTALARYRWTDS